MVQFGNAALDDLVEVLLEFHGSYGKEHRPFFFDWEKQISFSLTRWKGTAPKDHTTAAPVPSPAEPAAEEPEEPEAPDVGSYDAPGRPQRLICVLVASGGLTDRPGAVRNPRPPAPQPAALLSLLMPAGQQARAKAGPHGWASTGPTAAGAMRSPAVWRQRSGRPQPDVTAAAVVLRGLCTRTVRATSSTRGPAR